MRQRIAALDALRGFALIGIILGNVTWFSGYAVATPAARSALGTLAIDRPLEFALHVAIDGKFYGLFSLMFGAGFAIMMKSSRASDASAAIAVRRRLSALLGIGLAHATLLWFGDILSLYAVAAVPLYWLRSWSTRRLVLTAIACLAAPVAVSAALVLAHAIAGAPDAAAHGHGPEVLLPAFASGTYRELLAANAAFLGERWVLALYSTRLVRILGLFVVGLLAVRLRADPTARARGILITSAVVANVVLVVLAGVAVRPASMLGLLRDAMYAVAIPLGSVAYAAALWPLLARRNVVTRALAAAGRMSLTHYVTQSLALSVIFYGWGFGAWGRVGLAGSVLIAAGVVVTQIGLSSAWERRFARGPAEWLLRRMTYPKRLHVR